MANMHGGPNRSSTSSSSVPTDLDDFSLFLHQIMLRSSSTSSSVPKANDGQSFGFGPTNNLQPDQDIRFSVPTRIPLSGSCVGFTSGSGAWLPGETAVNNVSSSSMNSVDNNELNEYDCESEEGLEGLILEAPAKPTTSRNPSKRSRAAEVHNLSEKRRRSRINEKMKALQNLIPNSNKTDKASMLDEAIEYLKQLQLQVQMLTMRNGVSLYPVCLPGVLQPNEISHMRMGYHEGNRSLNENMARPIPLDHTNPTTNMLFTVPDHYPTQDQTSVDNLRKLNDADTLELETTPQVHPQARSFQLPPPVCSEVSQYDDNGKTEQ